MDLKGTLELLSLLPPIELMCSMLPYFVLTGSTDRTYLLSSGSTDTIVFGLPNKLHLKIGPYLASKGAQDDIQSFSHDGPFAFNTTSMNVWERRRKGETV